ncbi:MAG: aminopeptidase N [Alphaproteobacteria bacterium]
MKTIYLKDYRPANYIATHIDLDFNLNPNDTIVKASTEYTINPDINEHILVLNGEDLILESVAIDDSVLGKDDYKLDDKTLTIENVPESFTLHITTRINPQENTKLEGLYISDGIFCTQCEAEGFRRITYFQDRPDVMCTWTTKLTADKKSYPILLSNGNEDGGDNYTDNQDGTHTAIWNDPFNKPCYLFALVAGDLVGVEQNFKTADDNNVKLKIYTDKGNETRLDYAMDSLVRSMKWDEDVWGRKYEHDVFHIVAVNSFNMGAMENTTLNIFNSRLILADKDVATDTDYANIEAVVGHEYFHNWTGNRITCRDWFQLSLKEGLTVFRDQEFSSDMRSRSVKRIEDVIRLRTHQFKEDASPLAHPVRPEEYVEINNFYTATVYEKGAEVIRMIHTLLGKNDFYRGANIYFNTYDGMATTCNNWVKCMEDASGKDLTQFKLWYKQSGTPTIKLTEKFVDNKYSLIAEQILPITPNQEDKMPMHIPLAIGVIDKDGNKLKPTFVYELKQNEEIIKLGTYDEKPIVSFNREFSAPINVIGLDDMAEKSAIFKYDIDEFNRWQAGQELFYHCVKQALNDNSVDTESVAFNGLIDGIQSVLNSDLENAYKALCITMPSLNDIHQHIGKDIDPELIYQINNELINLIASNCSEQTESAIFSMEKILNGEFKPDAESAGARSLFNACWAHKVNEAINIDELEDIYNTADNMTIKLSALKNILTIDNKNPKLNDFYEQYKNNTNVMDKFFMIQAINHKTTADDIRQLMIHEKFSIKNPNKVRSLIGAFAGNPVAFHNKDGSGYKLLADVVIELNDINPQIGARIVQVFSSWKNYSDTYSNLMKSELERIISLDNISDDIAEMATKMLK